MLSRHCRIGQWKGIGGESGEHQQYLLNGGSQTIVVGPKGPGILRLERPCGGAFFVNPTGGEHRRQPSWSFHLTSDLMRRINAFIPLSGQRALIAERSERIHLMQYRRGEYILNRLKAQTAIQKVVSLTYRGVAYEKQL